MARLSEIQTVCFYCMPKSRATKKKSHKCEGGGAHLRISLVFIYELEKQLFI